LAKGRALDVAGLLQALAECPQAVCERVSRLAEEEPDHRHRRLLRARRQRQRPGGVRAAGKRDGTSSGSSSLTPP